MLPLLVDWTSLDAYDGAPVAAHARDLCAARPDAVLAAAIVTYSRKQGNMAWGHSALRFLRCERGALHDESFEAYRFGAYSRELLAWRHPEAAFLDDPDYLRDLRGALVWFRNDGTVDNGHYGLSQASNREILELWLPPDDLEGLYAAQVSRLLVQAAAFDALAPLPDRYRPLGDNCTAHLRRDLAGDAVLPWAWWRQFRDRAVLAVLYPSHHAARRWLDDPPQQTTRLHPVFRSRRRLRPHEAASLAEIARADTPAILALIPAGAPSLPGVPIHTGSGRSPTGVNRGTGEPEMVRGLHE